MHDNPLDDIYPPRVDGDVTVIIVFDITEDNQDKMSQTFEDIRYVMSEVYRYRSTDINYVLVGNKCNQIPLKEVARDEVQEYVQNNRYILGYYEVSTETSENINELFQCLVKIRHPVQSPEGV